MQRQPLEVMVTDSASTRVLRALADAGVLHAGGVLVGTQETSLLHGRALPVVESHGRTG